MNEVECVPEVPRNAFNFIHLDGFNDDGEINVVCVFSFAYFGEVVAYYECFPIGGCVLCYVLTVIA